jgi:uncharacterized membrane protein
MVLMALDHTRDFVHADAFRFDPTDLTRTHPALFFTRWITHFCAPVFIVLAGTSAYLQQARGVRRPELSRFLITRGAWLVVLEFTLVRCGMWFNFDYSFLGLVQVIWVIGVSMIVLAGVIYLPGKGIVALAATMIVLHNAFDGVHVAGWEGPGTPAPGVMGKIWIVLHQSGEFFPVFGSSGPVVWLMYPLVPWIGVMALGYVAGSLYTLEAGDRVRALRRLGVAMIGAFVLLRLLNVYGDPVAWQRQDSWPWTMLAFINTTKYPASLLFLLMTLGPALVLLSLIDGREWGPAGRPFVLFGRVPLFYYLLQWPVIHILAIMLAAGAGKDIGYLFRSPPEIFTTAPPDAGFSLAMVYAAWLATLAVLYVLCRWFAGVKRRLGWPVLRYL